MAHRGHHLNHAHSPGAIACVRHRRTIISSLLGSNNGRQRIAAVAPTHGCQKRPGLFEAQVAVGYRIDVADVGGHHYPSRHGPLQFPQHLTWVQPTAFFGRCFFDHVDTEVVGFFSPIVEFVFPRGLLRDQRRLSLGTVLVGHQRALSQPRGQRGSSCTGIAANPDVNLFDQAEHLRISINLDDLGLCWPIVEAMLRQGAKGPQTGAERQHHVSPCDQLHRRF